MVKTAKSKVALPLTNCVTFVKLPNFSGLVSHLKKKENNNCFYSLKKKKKKKLVSVKRGLVSRCLLNNFFRFEPSSLT